MKTVPSDYFSKLGYTDYRKPENKILSMLKHYEWRRITGDLDHTLFNQIICENLTTEQKIWYSLLFGMTYRTAQSYAYLHTFPDFHAYTVSDYETWNSDNWKRTSYGIDTRYNKGKFSEQVKSIKDWLKESGHITLESKINSYIIYEDATNNFYALKSGICELYKYGRMTSWLTLQCLYDVLDLNIDPNTALVSDPSNHSCYNGAVYLSGREDIFEGKHNHINPGYSPTKEDRLFAEASSNKHWEITRKSFPHWHIDAYRWETVLCQIKKMEVTKNEYLGLSCGEASETYEFLAEWWPEIDRKQYAKALLSIHPKLCARSNMKNVYSNIFYDYGVYINQDILDLDAPDVYYHLDIPETPLVKILVEEGKTLGFIK